MDFKEFIRLSEGGWYSDGKEGEDAKKWYKKDPHFGDMTRKPSGNPATGPAGAGTGNTSMGPGSTMMMKKKMKKKQKKS